MENIVAILENHLTFKDRTTGKILAIETQNGHLERYDCEETNNSRTNKLFGTDTTPLSRVTREVE